MVSIWLKTHFLYKRVCFWTSKPAAGEQRSHTRHQSCRACPSLDIFRCLACARATQ